MYSSAFTKKMHYRKYCKAHFFIIHTLSLRTVHKSCHPSLPSFMALKCLDTHSLEPAHNTKCLPLGVVTSTKHHLAHFISKNFYKSFSFVYY